MSSHHNSLRWRSGVNLVVIAAALVAITVITNAYSFNLMLRNFRQSLSSTALIYTRATPTPQSRRSTTSSPTTSAT